MERTSIFFAAAAFSVLLSACATTDPAIAAADRQQALEDMRTERNATDHDRVRDLRRNLDNTRTVRAADTARAQDLRVDD